MTSRLFASSKSKTKFGNVRTNYNNRTYSSKAEAEWAKSLDILQRAGKIRFWLPQQLKFTLTGATDSEKAQTYTADFFIAKNDGTYLVADCKGYDTDISRLKRATVREKYGINVLTVFNDVLDNLESKGDNNA